MLMSLEVEEILVLLEDDLINNRYVYLIFYTIFLK